MKNVLIIHQPVLDSVVEILDYADVYELSTIIDLKSDYYENLIAKKECRYCVYKFYCKTEKKYKIVDKPSSKPPKHCPTNKSHIIDENSVSIIGYYYPHF